MVALDTILSQLAGPSEIVETMMAGTTAAEQSSRRDTPPRPVAWGIGLLVGAGIFIGGWILWTELRYKQAILEVEDQIAKGRYSAACRNLEALLAQKADVNGGLLYQLGFCELARGHIEATEKAWTSIEPGTEFTERAIRGRALLLQNEGKIAEAERLVIEAANDRRNDRTSLMVLLVPIMIDLGRQDEATELIEDRWANLNARGRGALDPALKLLLQHVELTTGVMAIDEVRSLLDEAAKLAPDDDRVWLGRANLAIRTGDVKDAERWLNECEKKRPDDRAVWRARLEWAMATDRVDAVERTMTRMPDVAPLSTDRHRINAWLAGQRGDFAKERSELELLLAADPGDLSAFDRLIDLHKKGGQPALAAEVSQKKIAVRELLGRYLMLHGRMQPIRDAEELARIAEQLGRRFEARGFLTIAVFQEPGRKDLREKLRTFDSRLQR
jgi:enediyne biosynthesis protein E4